MSSKIFNEHKDEIRDYCVKNNLSFNSLCESPWCYDNEELNILQNDSDTEREKLGMKDNIPIPTVLKIFLDGGKLRFAQTEGTRRYLGVEGEAKLRVA
ncbi:hypothetical protein R80B4_02361 [Fibrobacteres bacterium R8-0-B4]